MIQPLLAPSGAPGGGPVIDPRQLRLPASPGFGMDRDEPFGRLAAIDIGSNSIHMIVVAPQASGAYRALGVAPQASGAYRVLGREREMVRLGKTGLGEGKLSETAMRR